MQQLAAVFSSDSENKGRKMTKETFSTICLYCAFACLAPFVLWLIGAIGFMLWDWIKALFFPKKESTTDKLGAICCFLAFFFFVFLALWAGTSDGLSQEQIEAERTRKIVREILKEMEVSNGTDSQTIPSSGE